MLEQAKVIHALAPNMQVKIPATAAGIRAMEEATYAEEIDSIVYVKSHTQLEPGDFVNVKITKNNDIVKFSYFEIKIKMNMDEEDIDRFLKCSKIILEDQGYQVYQLGEKYNFEGEQRKVEDNEFLVAIPNNTVKM